MKAADRKIVEEYLERTIQEHHAWTRRMFLSKDFARICKQNSVNPGVGFDPTYMLQGTRFKGLGVVTYDVVNRSYNYSRQIRALAAKLMDLKSKYWGTDKCRKARRWRAHFKYDDATMCGLVFKQAKKFN